VENKKMEEQNGIFFGDQPFCCMKYMREQCKAIQYTPNGS